MSAFNHFPATAGTADIKALCRRAGSIKRTTARDPIAAPLQKCLTSAMNRWVSYSIVFPVLAALALLSGCHRPTSDPVKLTAIETEAVALMAMHPATPPRHYTRVPKNQWPATIASLQPELVTVHKWGVDVLIKPHFDGGWGYHIVRQRRDLPMLDECYLEVSHGVFWHGPC